MTSPLELWIEPDAFKARKALPGQVRQRVRREIEALAGQPRPHNSRALDVTGLDVRKVSNFAGYVWSIGGLCMF